MILYSYKKRRDRYRFSRGAVLIQVLGVLLVLLIIFLAVLTYALNRYSVHQRHQNRLVAKYLAQAGVTRTLSTLNHGESRYAQVSHDAPNGGRYSASVLSWGPYLLIQSDGTFANQTVRTTALAGSRPPEFVNAAITVCDETFPLVFTGNSRIVGDINVGPLEIQTGRIHGEGIVDEEFHRGTVHHFPSLEVPEIDSTVLQNYLQDMHQRRLQSQRTLAGSRVLDNTETLSDNPTLVVEENLLIKDIEYNQYEEIQSIFAGGRIEIGGNTRLGGLIEIVADGPIILSDSAILDEVLLYTTDSIVIRGNVQFSGIAISKSRIIVTENSRLKDPSMILVNGRGATCDTGCGIVLESRQPMEAICSMTLDSASETNEHFLMYLDTMTLFMGLLISEGRTDVRGSIIGSVITEQFHYFVPPTTYVNWIKDFRISRPQLTYLPIPPILEGDTARSNYLVWRQDTQP